MVMLTGLDRVIAGAELPFTKQSGADTRTAHRGGLREVKGVIWHTTETADNAFRDGRTAPTLAYVTRQTSYNVLVGRDGHVYIIASGTAAHAGRGSGHGFTRDDANRETIGVSFDANSSNHPVTIAQLDAGARLGAALDKEWKGGLRHVMHGEWAPGRRSDPTQVPGGWSALRAAIERGSWEDAGNTPAPSKPSTSTASSGSSSKSIATMAAEVIAGKHGSGHDNRRRSLGVDAATYEQVRAEVNRRSGVSTPAPSSRPATSKTVAQQAQEVIDGRHGTGHAQRQRSLGVSDARYAQIRAEVNRRAGGGSATSGKSVKVMAAEVLAGKHGNGHAQRQRSLGVDAATYARVRAEVNKRA